MTTCSYGKWGGRIFTRLCSRQAQYVVDGPTQRQMCSHHAAIAEALGWHVYNVMRPGVPPAYDAPRVIRQIA